MDLGIKKEDRVVINGFPSIEWMEIFFATQKIGAAMVNMNPRYMEEEFKYVMEDCDGVCLFTEDRWIDLVEKVRRDLPLLKHIIVYNAPGYPPKEHPADPIYRDYEDFMGRYPATEPKLPWGEIKNDDLSQLYYTGGTTGWPKGVVRSQWDICGNHKYGMVDQLADSGWDGIIDNIIDRDFMRGFAALVAGTSMGPILSRTINILGDIISRSDLLKNTLPPILKSKGVKKLVLNSILPRIIRTTLGRILLGGGVRSSTVVPFFHSTAFDSNLGQILNVPSTSIYLEPSHPLDAKLLLEEVERRRLNFVSIVGDASGIKMLEELDRAKAEGRTYDLSSIWVIFNAGARWSAHIKKGLLDYIPQAWILDIYGTTESGLASAYISGTGTKEKTESYTHTTWDGFGEYVGRPGLVIDLDTKKEAKPGCKHAEYYYGGTFKGLGYWKAPEKSKSDFITIDGWRYHRSRDEGYVDENEKFHLSGRGGGFVINTGGEKVYSEEVQEVILSHPKVKDVAVIGIPDERWGEAVTAIVELEPGEKVTEDEMKGYCREKIAGYKIPKNVIFREVLRAATDKISKIEIDKMRGMAIKELGR